MSNNRIGIIIQARQTSSRFPGKSLAPLLGKPIIEWVVERARKVSSEIPVIVVIPDNAKNDDLNEKLISLNVHVIRGSENNVASRFIEAINEFQLDHVIRVCADNPLLSPKYVRFLIEFYFGNGQRYSFNHMPRFGIQINDGLGAEMFNADVFQADYKEFVLEEEFEHVTHKFARNCSENDCAVQNWMLGRLKLDVDTIQDLEYVEHFVTSNNIDIDSKY